MPSQPTAGMRRYSSTMQDMTIGAMQEAESFVAQKAAPYLPVNDKSATYYTYPQGEWQRRQMTPRGPSEESGGGGWTQSTDSYACERYAVHHNEDWAESSDADPAFNVDEDNAEFLANQVIMDLDYKWQATCMLPATWTTDYDGVSSGPTGAQFLQWDDSSSDPQKDIMTLQAAIHALIGRRANAMVVGADVHTEIITNSVVRDAIKHTEKTFIDSVDNNAQLASFFGVTSYSVAGGINNTAKPGQAKSMAYIVNAKDVWLGYVSTKKGRRVLTAARTMAWGGPDGVGADGIVNRKFDIEKETTTRYEVESFHDVKIVAVDAGAFIDDAVA